jgi:hypothetical protein
MIKKLENILNFDLASILKQWYKKADKPLLSSFIITFLALSLIFLYHGAQYIFGDHDWKYLQYGVELNAGLFEGRFTQFIPINLLSFGEILPIINNLLGFLFFSLSISFLAKYWSLPHKKLIYTLFALFTAITPYILSFMYFAFLIIPVLSWSLFIISALIISKKEQTFSFIHTLTSALLYTFALGGYPPVINLFATALSTRILLDIIYEKATLKSLYTNYRYSVLNFILGAILYKLCLMWLNHSGAIETAYYNLQTTPFNQWGDKFILVLKDMLKQLIATLPFISLKYKLITLLITILALLTTFKQKSSSMLLKALFFTAIFLSALITLFLATSIRETEFAPRIDFFGLMYSYSAMLAIVLKSKKGIIKNLTTLLATISIIYSAYTLFEAQKVWKLGFDTELSLYKRVIKRFESDPMFNIGGHYNMIQGGSPSYRHKFYHEPYNYNSDDLLTISYVPGMNAGVMWNYYGQREFASKIAYVYITPKSPQLSKALENATVWPHKNSVIVLPNQIITVLTEDGLTTLHQQYK